MVFIVISLNCSIPGMLTISTCMYSRCIVAVHVILAQLWIYSQTVENGSIVTLKCLLSGSLPEWKGPPNAMSYSYLNDTIFNPDLGQEKLRRLHWAFNKRDLNVFPVTRDDQGSYQCFNGGDIWWVNLHVRGMLKV